MEVENLRRALNDGAKTLGLFLAAPAQDALLRYVALLEHWNRAYNFTAVRDPADMIPKHLLDSLAVLPWLNDGRTVIDVGTGPGLPGIPLALAAPERRYTLMDPSAKRHRFLRQAVNELGLRQVSLHRGRAEDYHPAAGFDTVICRALVPLPRLLGLVGHLCGPGGAVLAMTGRRPEKNLACPTDDWAMRVHTLAVPGLDAQRHLLVFERQT